MKKSTNSFAALACLSMLVVGSTASAHDGEHKANPGYVGDMSGHIEMDGSGNCLRTIDFDKEKYGLAECGDGPAKQAAKPAPAPAPAPKPVVREDITLGAHALFNHDKSSLRPEGMRELDDLAAKLKSFSSVQNINVIGHTDSQGTDAYNQGLSERRAASVKAYLIQQGINGSVISTSGSGESSPATSNATAEGRQQNRRVEIGIRATK